MENKRVNNESMMIDSELGVEVLGLSRRTENALLKNGIKTVSDLRKYDDADLCNIRGIGETCLREIIQIDLSNLNLEHRSADKLPTISEYYEQHYPTKMRNYSIFVDYYNCLDSTYDSVVPEGESLSRERIRQIVCREMRRIVSLIRGGKVDSRFLEIVIEYARSVTRMDHVFIGGDKYLNGIALAMIATKVHPDKVSIYSDFGMLRHKWVVDDIDKVGEALFSLSDLLFNDAAQYSLNDLAVTFGVSKAIILDINYVVNNGGYVTTRSNNRSMGGDNIKTRILDYMNEIRRPVTTSELVMTLELTENQVRGAIFRMNDLLNVGQSMYSLKDDEYEGQSVTDLIRGYLKASERPVRIEKIIWYVRQYRHVLEEDIKSILFDQNSAFMKTDDCTRVWFKGMDWDKKTRDYDISVDDAIIEIFKRNDRILDRDGVAERILNIFGERVSNNLNTIGSGLARLAGREVLRRVGDDSSGFYARGRDFMNRIEEDMETSCHISAGAFSYPRDNYP